MRKSKKTLMGIAALLILIFHLYIPFTGSGVEKFIYRGAFIGVDLFFLLSGESLGKRGNIQFVSFIKNRLTRVYLPFVVMGLIMAVYKKWSFVRLVKVLTTMEFLQRGGGAFLWFAPGIMLLYLIVPFISKAKEKWGLKSLGLCLAVWLGLAVFFHFVLPNKQLYILINRLPIFILGFYADMILKKKLTQKLRYALCGSGLIIGVILVELYGVARRLNKPIPDMYYILAIPLVLALALFVELCYEKAGKEPRFLTFLGGFTLELYGFQMIFGFDLEPVILKTVQIKPLAFLMTSTVVCLVAWGFKKLEGVVETTIRKQNIRRKK